MMAQKSELSNLQDDPGPRRRPKTRSFQWKQRLLPCLRSWSESSPRNDFNLDVGGTGRSSPLRTTTVIELEPTAFSLRSPIAFTIQSQCDYAIKLTDSLDLAPLTAFVLPNTRNLRDELLKKVASYKQNDDVFCEAFLNTILVVLPPRDGPSMSISRHIIDLPEEWGCRNLLSIRTAATEKKISPGPYFFSNRGLYQAWRLFPDEVDAFVSSTIPSQDDPYTYENLNAMAYGGPHLCIAVPSRLRFSDCNEPLAGTRIAVKDLFHLKGIRTGCGNRAYRALRENVEASSPALQHLLSLGCIIMGKTKTVEFGGTQEVIGDWCDYSYPFNIRADGYLAATGSSTGSASALAAYPYIDVTLGTDAGGSVRDPAVAHGLFGFRPTHDGDAAEDVVLPCRVFHTLGFLTRSSELMLKFGSHWPKPLTKVHFRPKRVLFPEEFFADRRDVQELVVRLVNLMAKWLDAELCKISIEALWQATKPAGAQNGFFETFRKTFIDTIYSEYWKDSKEFRQEYESKFGTKPYVCKTTQFLWNQGEAMSIARIQEIQHERRLHNEWFLKNYLNDEESIIVVPRYKLDYRDEYLPAPEYRGYEGFDSNLHASFSGVPNVIVPVGQCAYESEITGRKEHFPVSLSITAPRGKDFGLLSLVHDYLKENNLPTEVLTGREAFPARSG